MGVASNNADSDRDGLTNLLEYAFQLNPTVASQYLLPQAVIAGANAEFNFTPPATTGISWAAEWSSTLQPNDWLPVPNTGIPPQQLYQMPTSGKDRAFMRLRLSVP